MEYQFSKNTTTAMGFEGAPFLGVSGGAYVTDGLISLSYHFKKPILVLDPEESMKNILVYERYR